RGVGEQFGGIAQLESGHAKHGLGAEEPARDNRPGNGGEHDGAEHAGAPASDDFLDHKQDGGDRRVEGGGETGGGAQRRDEPHSLAREVQPAPDGRGETGAHLQRGIFRTEGVSAADGKRRGDELPDDGAKGNGAVVDVDGGLGLIDAAAASAREEAHHQKRDEQSGRGRGRQGAQWRGGESRAEHPQARPFNGETEADHGQAGVHADHNRQQQEVLFFAEKRAWRLAQDGVVLAGGSGARAHGTRASPERPIRSRARSAPVAGPQFRSAAASAANTVLNTAAIASGLSCSRAACFSAPASCAASETSAEALWASPARGVELIQSAMRAEAVFTAWRTRRTRSALVISGASGFTRAISSAAASSSAARVLTGPSSTARAR